MLAALTLEMKSALESTVYPVAATADQVWGYSLSEILKLVIEKAKVLGRAYRDEIEQAAKAAVDKLVALDLPYIPDYIEKTLDEATRSLGYAAVEKMLDALLAENV
jgi:hypothetical protein